MSHETSLLIIDRTHHCIFRKSLKMSLLAKCKQTIKSNDLKETSNSAPTVFNKSMILYVEIYSKSQHQ